MKYRKLLTQPQETIENPFTNQRARNKWNEYAAKEYAVESPSKTKRGNPFQKMDTFD